MILTEENVKHCPNCDSTSFAKDYVREETYCTSCGLVLSSAVQYVGLEKVDNAIPYSAPSEARRGIHYRWGGSPRRPKTYRHSFTDRQLMRKGKK